MSLNWRVRLLWWWLLSKMKTYVSEPIIEPRHILYCCYYFTISFEYVLASVQDGADRMQEDRIGLE